MEFFEKENLIMEIYLGLTIFVMLLGVIISSLPISLKLRKLSYTFLCTLVMCMIAGLRSLLVGTDIVGYLRAIDYAKGKDFSFVVNYSEEPFHFEYGYLMLTRLLAWFDIETMAFLFLIAFLIYVPTMIFYYRYSWDMAISLSCYCCFQFYGLSFSAVRQMVAISIVLLMIPHLLRRQKWKWLFGIGSAMLFHITAIVMLPLYWINNIRYRLPIYIMFLGAEGISIVLGNYFLTILSLAPGLKEYFMTHVSKSDFSISDIILLVIINVLIFTVTVLQKRFKRNSIESLCIYALMGASLVIILSFFTGNILKRINMYYFLFVTLLIPYALRTYLSPLYRCICTGILYIGLIIYLIVYLSGADSLHLNPYYFFWE